MAVQSPLVAVMIVLRFKAALVVDVTMDIEVDVDMAGIDVGKLASQEKPQS